LIVGGLIAYFFASKEAESASNDLRIAMSRLRSEVEDNAFKWKILNEEQRENAIIKLGMLIDEETGALMRQQRQLKNAEIARGRMTEAQDAQAASLAILAVKGLDEESSFRQAFLAGRRFVTARDELIEATFRLEAAELLLGTTHGVTTESIVDQEAEVARLQLRWDAYQAIVAGTVETFEEYLRMINNIKLASEILEKGLQDEIGLTAKQTIQMSELIEEYSKNEIAVKDLKEELELWAIVMEHDIAIEKEMGKETGTLSRIYEELQFALRQAEMKMTVFEKALIKSAEKSAILLAGTDKLKIAYIEHIGALRAMILEQVLLGKTMEEILPLIEAMQAALELTNKEIREGCDDTKDLTKCMSDESKAMETIWDQAMRNIQDAFADAFKGAFDSFESFADKLLGAFKDLLAEMAALALLNNIFGKGSGFFNDFISGVTGNFGAVLGGSGGSAASAAAGGAAGSVTSGVAGLGASGLSKAFQGFVAGAATFFQGMGAFFGIGESAINGLLLVQANTGIGGIGAGSGAIATEGGALAGAGAVVAGAGIGALTGAAADAIFGSRGDPTRNAIFAAIGGAIGSIWGPIGSVIGGAIGSLVNNIFGGAQKLEAATLELRVVTDNLFGTQETIVSKQKSFFRGRDFTTTRRGLGVQLQGLQEVFRDFVDVLEQGAEALGGSAEDFIQGFTFSKDISVLGANAVQIQTIIADFLNDAMVAAIREWLRDVEGISMATKQTLRVFVEDVESFVIALDALGAIETLFNLDLLAEASTAIEESQVGILEAYNRSLDGYREVIAAYDGSLESLILLTDATAIMIQVQLELITLYEQTGAAISTLFQDSAQFIRESLLSDEELFNLRKTQIDELIALAEQTTDPAELTRLANLINDLGLDAFNLLDEDQRAALGPEFIEFFEMLDELFGGRIDEGIENVLADQAALDEEVSNRLLEAAEALLEAARELAAANALAEFQNENGGGGNRGGDQNEQRA